jgi:subtilisin family serine protease
MVLCSLVLLANLPLDVHGQARLGGPVIGDPGETSNGTEGSDTREMVLIRAAKPYASLVTAIRKQGGEVTYQYDHFDAVAATVPRAALGAIGSLVGLHAITKDLMIQAPDSVDTLRGRGALPARTGEEERITFESASAIPETDLAAFAAAHPEAYAINNSHMNVGSLHAGGVNGSGVIVAVIDSGLRPGFPHLELDGSIIGGEDFVGDGLGVSNTFNGGHGTFVAGMISANVTFSFNPLGTFFRSVQAHAPGATIAPNQVPMVGTAPRSSIFAMRVFSPTGSAPTSRILAAMNRAITLRQMYDAGMPGGVNIQVVNMSLSGPALFPGRDLFDTATDLMVDRGIVVVSSAGNAGPSGMTIGGPASSFGSLAVGAASLAHNERILRDLQFGFGAGALFRPFDGSQSAVFSSRGPNADGRLDPEVTASGFGSFGMGFSGTSTINISSGTSFSSPTVAGVAALLRQAFPSATARQIRNAIAASANPGFLDDGSTTLDQGGGFVDAQAAYDLLAAGSVPDALPAPPAFSKSVKDNIQSGAGLAVERGLAHRHVSGLKPGQRHEIIYEVGQNIQSVVIQLSNVTPALPPDQQNLLFGDDLLLTVHSAKTSRQPGDGDYKVLTFTLGGTFTIQKPESGLIRVTLNGDWTNAGDISADVTIFSVTDPVTNKTLQGRIGPLETLMFQVQVPPGLAQADFRMVFREDWSNYPVNDVDMILVNPVGAADFRGATLNAPESAVFTNPMPGTWTVFINGFEIHTVEDKFEVRVALDGNVVH